MSLIWLTPLLEDWPADVASRITDTHHACKHSKETFAARADVVRGVFQPMLDNGLQLNSLIEFVVACMQAGTVASLTLPILNGSTKVLRIPHEVKVAWLAMQALGGIESDPPIRGTLRLGCMSLHRLWACSERLSIARLQAVWLMWWQLSHFPQEQRLQHDLLIERHCVDPTRVPLWLECATPLGSLALSADLRIEDAAAAAAAPVASPAAAPAHECSRTAAEGGAPNYGARPAAHAVVDFANKQLHIGKVIPSCTQEEVMFSVRPEAYLCIPLAATMASDEVITIRGARQVCDYAGYGSRFRVCAFEPPPTASTLLPRPGVTASGKAPSPGPGSECSTAAATKLPSFLFGIEEHIPAVLAMDALWLTDPKRQFRRDALERDLNKAVTSFASVVRGIAMDCPSPADPSTGAAAEGGGAASLVQNEVCVSTGKWGCGVFNGDVTLKVLQQWAAASVAGVSLRVSTFGHPRQAAALGALAQHLQSSPSMRTVGGLLSAIDAYGLQVLEGTKAVSGLGKHLLSLE